MRRFLLVVLVCFTGLGATAQLADSTQTGDALLDSLLQDGFSWKQAAAPAIPPQPTATLSGGALRTWLKANWYTGLNTAPNYSTARTRMYESGGIDRTGTNSVTCVYTGFVDDINSNTFPDPINTEHTIPQSYFNEAAPMQGDIHHLFPTHEDPNRIRSNFPFSEIPDASATEWHGIVGNTYTEQATKPASGSDNWSEAASSTYEVREDHKGDCARAIFYFYTMHPNQANVSYSPPAGDSTGITRVVLTATNTVASDVALLYQWHIQDPPSAKEIARNIATATAQGNYNPYISYPDLVARAWGVSTTGISCSAQGTVNAGNTATVNWSSSEAFVAGNVFTVQLSNASGSFASPTNIGTVTGTADRSLVVTIPSNTPAGTGYRIRVNSSSPVFTGSDNGSNITVTTNPVITLGTVPTSFAQGGTYDIPYTATNTFNGGNVLAVHLSDPSGSFSGYTTIGSSTTSATSGTITVNIPGAQTLGTGYRIRLRSSNPFLTSADNGSNITVTVATPNDAPTLVQRLTVGPNPSYGTVTLRGMLRVAVPVGITVQDLTGRVLATFPSGTPQREINTTLDLQGLPGGMYILQVVAGTETAHMRLVLLE